MAITRKITYPELLHICQQPHDHGILTISLPYLAIYPCHHKWYNLNMITEKDKKTIQEISKKYSAKRVLLFGSSIDAARESRDIDIAVEGISPKDFFRYYGDLLFALSKPVDVVDLSGNSKFISLIKQEGVLLYG